MVLRNPADHGCNWVALMLQLLYNDISLFCPYGENQGSCRLGIEQEFVIGGGKITLP